MTDPTFLPEDVAQIAAEGHQVWVRGELDLLTEPIFQVALDKLDSSGRSAAIVDLSAVTFMDYSGLRPLLRARLVLGDRLLLLAPSPQVLRVLDLLMLRELLHVVPASVQPVQLNQPGTGTTASGWATQPAPSS